MISHEHPFKSSPVKLRPEKNVKNVIDNIHLMQCVLLSVFLKYVWKEDPILLSFKKKTFSCGWCGSVD